MKYCVTIVTINLDESKLTSEQQAQAAKANTDLKVDHPLEEGMEKVCDFINAEFLMESFSYLGEGANAVSIEIGD